MASEYLKWKYRDVKPDEKKELTPAEKRKNWWHYHKWHIAIGIVLAGIAANIIWHALGFGQTKPDYQIAYVGENPLPDDTAAAVEDAFAALGEDLNGDGQVVVRLNQYPTASTDVQVTYANETLIMADIMNGDSYFFLLEDPEQFQLAYRSLCKLDGSLPEEGEYSAEGTYLLWDQCPVLAGTELGGYSYDVLGETVSGDSSDLVSGLAVARRGFWSEKDAAYPEGWAALWDALTEGAAK